MGPLLGFLLLAGCADNSDGLTKDQSSINDRFQTIMTKSEGKWERLTPEDKQYIVGELSNGDEAAAQRMFEMRSKRAEGLQFERESTAGGGPTSTKP